MLPVSFKKQLASVMANGFVLKRAVFQPCLELYPMNQWELLMQNINKLNRFKKKNNDFIRRFTAGVKVVEIDALGRLLVPKDLVAFASISKDLVLSSAVNIEGAIINPPNPIEDLNHSLLDCIISNFLIN